MKHMKKVISMLLALIIFAIPFSMNVRATNAADETMVIESYTPITELFFEYDYDTTQVFRYDSMQIPVNFHIKGLRKGQTCTISVDSSLEMNMPMQRQLNVYNSENNYVDFSFTFSAETAYPMNSRTESLSVDYISITADSELDGTTPCTLTMYVLCSSYGTFVSYIGEEELQDYYYKWKYENGIISESEYESYLSTKGLTEPIDEQTYLSAINSTKLARSVQGTSVYISYKITASGSNLTVSGILTWKDINGTSHALKQAKVEVVDEDVMFDDIVGTTYTSSNGTFSVTFPNQTESSENGGCDIFVRAYPASTNIAVKTTANGNYSLYTPTIQDVTESTETMYQVLKPCNTANAFQIHQAGIVGAQYVESLSGTAPELLNFRYPYSDSGSSNYNNFYVSIIASHYYSWDVILHEYGHYIQDVYNIENNPGGTHIIDDNIIDTLVSEGASLEKAKDKGCRLAWAEGWATYFSLSAQLHQNVASLGVPGAGDATYHDMAEDWARDCESYTGHGEGNEMAVTCVLWDLADSASWNGSKTEAHDTMELGYQTVWNYSVDSGAKTFSEFMNYVYTKLSITNFKNVGSILAAQNMTADSPKTNNSTSANYYFSSDSAPTFTWSATNGSSQCVDLYSIQVLDTSMNFIYATSLPSGTTSYTLPNDVWELIKTNYSEGFYWCVRVTPSSSPSTGPYYSRFTRCYLTNIL